MWNIIMMSSSRILAWVVWGATAIFYAYQYILRVMPNIIMDDLLLKFDIGTKDFGQFSGIYYIGYSAMHLPLGILLDRFGPKRVMPICILLTVLGLLPAIFTDNWTYPILGRFIMGMGSSAAILGAFKIIRITFSKAHFTRMLSLCVTVGLIGAIYGGAPVNYMLSTMGLENLIITFAAIGIALALISYIIIPNIEPVHGESVLAEVKEVLGNHKVILVCIFAGLMVGPLEGFADVWGAAFLKQVYNFDGTAAASLPSMIFIGMCFGAPLLSLIAEKTGSYLGTIVASGVIMASVFTWLLTGNMSVTPMTITFVIVGVCCAYQILAIYKASTYVNDNVVGMTTALANMIIMVFGYAFHTIIGSVLEYVGPATETGYVYAISIIPVALTIGVAGFTVIMIREMYSS